MNLNKKPQQLGKEAIFSVYYHNLFDYPLGNLELIKWEAGKECFKYNLPGFQIEKIKGQYVVAGKRGHVYKKEKRQRTSQRKALIAKKGINLLSKIPTVKMIGISGALAMESADENSDIDLFLICQKGSLWTSRALALLVLKLWGVKVRRFGQEDQKDKLCLNMWLDETFLSWPKTQRNVYTAHEIAQILPVVNKGNTYQRFIYQNSWVRDFWPNAVKVPREKPSQGKNGKNINLIEKVLRNLQYMYMKNKITRETVTKTKAIFHPTDWSKKVLEQLSSKTS